MSRPLSPRHLVPGGLLAGLALTGTALSLGAGHHPLAPAAETTPVSQAAVAPSPLPAPVRAARASRSAPRTALVGYVRREVRVGHTFSGYASWYGGSFQGRRTASGERFDTNELTAASRTLAFGTRLRVCRSTRCVVVRVNDRGPYVSSRVLDLSRAARDRLGFSGVARVTATPVATRTVAVRRPVPAAPPPSPAAAPVLRPVLAAQSAPVPARQAPQSMLTTGMLLVAASLSLWLWGRRAS
jgi:rare lipoprotein A